MQHGLFLNHTEKLYYPLKTNISSLPHYSPFRYPGGKTWLIPIFRKWVRSLSKRPSLLIEPFAGSGVISLTALFEHLVDRVIMVEIDEEVSAVWLSILNGGASLLSDRILKFNPSYDEVRKELTKPAEDIHDKAFKTILKNRVVHGGILAKGAGLMRLGEKRRGVASRWYPKTLVQRIEAITQIAHLLEFRQDDGMKVMLDFMDDSNVIFFIDPPYTLGKECHGKRLYNHHDIDHRLLLERCALLKGDFIATYNNDEEVKKIIANYRLDMRILPMQGRLGITRYELLIGKNLTWLDQ
ncbi:MAG: DNA adenine methylase [Methylacidiphilales bacterium]|nr:DNA adenine methylase [Candidatus Methylacidiphilales bacterium]